MKIRNTSINDLDSIENIRKRSWLDTYVNNDNGITEDIVKNILLPASVSTDRRERLLNLKNAINDSKKINLVVCGDGDIVVGYLYGEVDDQRNKLHSIYLDPDFKKMGLGSMLVEEFLEHCNPNKPTTLGVFAMNSSAIKFYEKFGFKYNKDLPIFADMLDSFEMMRLPKN